MTKNDNFSGLLYSLISDLISICIEKMNMIIFSMEQCYIL